MRPVSPKKESEAAIQARIVSALVRSGWTCVAKTHGNCYQPGWPDLYVFGPRGHRWVEVKTPSGSLTQAQRARFACWTAAGIEVHVMCDGDLSLLYKPANWEEWLTEAQRDSFKRLRQILAPNGPTHTTPEQWVY